MRYWAKSRHAVAYLVLTAAATALAVRLGDTSIPLPNVRVGPWNRIALAYLLATVPSFAWLSIARIARTPMEPVATIPATLRLLDQLIAVSPPALASLAAARLGGQTNAAISRNLLFTTGISLVLLYLLDWLVAAVALLSYLIASGLGGFGAGQRQPDPWAFVLGDGYPSWSRLAVLSCVAASCLLAQLPARGTSAYRFALTQIREPKIRPLARLLRTRGPGKHASGRRTRRRLTKWG